MSLIGLRSELTRLGDNPHFEDIAEAIQRFFVEGTESPEFVRGQTRIPLNVPTYGAAEVIEALDSLMSTWVTMGKKVKAFEEMWAGYIGQSHGIMTNSGSSANLLALTVLGLKSKDQVITPALTWSTTIFPIAQAGALPVLVDVQRDSYNIDPQAIEDAINPRTRVIMVVHLLGNPCNMDAIMDIADRHNLIVLEDCCEAHGAEYHGKKVGSFDELSTYSFFFSHHISTIEGGMVLTGASAWADDIRSLRAHGWVREMSNRDEIAAENPSVDPRFLFATPGYNFRPTEIGGAFGIHQLPRLEGLVELRRENAAYFNRVLADYQDYLTLPSEAPETRHSYFAYPITVNEQAPFTKKELQDYLESRGLETRPIEGGNMAIQPAMKYVPHLGMKLDNAQYINDNGFFFGNHQGIGEEQREAIVSYFREFMGGARCRS